MDEQLYRVLKQIEIATHNMFLSIPMEGSESYKALNIQNKDKWRMGAMIDCLSWFQEVTKKSATIVYMSDKD